MSLPKLGKKGYLYLGPNLDQSIYVAIKQSTYLSWITGSYGRWLLCCEDMQAAESQVHAPRN